MLTATLPQAVENMAVKRMAFATELVRTDGGAVHANARWEDPLAEWDVVSKPYKRNANDYVDTVNLFRAAMGSANTFLLHDVETCTDTEVRFKDDTLAFQPEGNLVRLAFTLEEVRNSGNSP